MSRENVPEGHICGPPPAERERRLAELAVKQHRAVGDDQMLRLGFSRKAIRYRLGCQRFQRIHPGVLAIGPGPLDQLGRWWAALLACRPSPALSHLSAAADGGLAGELGAVHITLPRRSSRRLEGVVVHQARWIDPLDLTRTEDDLPVTALHRTLLDLAEILPYHRLGSIIEEADRRELLDLAALRACMDRSPGRRGLAPLARLLDDYLPVGGAKRGLERAFQRFLAEEGFPQPLKNVIVAGHEVDCHWPEHNFVVELDSREFHRHWRQQERDRARDGALLRASIPHLRVTHHRLSRERGELVADLASQLPRSQSTPQVR